MTDAQLLDAFQTSMSMQITLLTQIVALHLAMIVGIYYFLGRAGLGLKLFAFFIYTVSYATFLAIVMLESAIGVWLSMATSNLTAGRESAVMALLERVLGSWLSRATSIACNLMLILLWFGVAYFLFFHRQPLRDSERAAAKDRARAPAEARARGKTARRRPVSAPIFAGRRQA